MPLPARKNLREKSVDGDGPVQARLQIPAGLVAEMREDRVDTGQSFGGIDLVEFILVGAVFYFYGEKAVAREVFEGKGCGSVQHADAQHEVIKNEGKCGE